MHVHTLPGRNTEVALRPHLYALVGGASHFFYEDEYHAMAPTPRSSENGGPMNGMKTPMRKPQAHSATPVLQDHENHNALDGLMLSGQFFCPSTVSHDYWTGSRRLMLGVLQEALASWFRYQRTPSKRGQRLFQETRDWFWSCDRSWLYAFESICEHLDLDPSYIRGRLTNPPLMRAHQRRPVVRRQPAYSAEREALAA